VIRPALALLLALTACTGDPPDPAPSPSPTASPSPALSADQVELARLATKAATARYDATYGFEAPATTAVGLLRIAASPPSYRVDITNHGSTSIFLATPARTVSCSITPAGTRSCFLVARAGEEVPDLFDPGVQHLFSDAVADLGQNPGAYVVRRARNIRLPGGLPDGFCFDVQRAAPILGEDPVGFESGRYCFAERGVMMLLAVKTGRITLRTLAGPPGPAVFQPVAPVAALPDATPSPTPSR
jgi:hypothetical protein